MSAWRDLLEKFAVTIIAFAVVGTVLFLPAYSLINAPESENTKTLVQATVTIGFAGVMVFFFTRDKGSS